jgi:hypothetical protein
MADVDSHGATLFRVCDARFPFLWTSVDQPAARWHDLGEGPCHYLATTAKGAWAEVIRHEAIAEPDDLEDLQRALWAAEAPRPSATPDLRADVMTGDESTYAECRAAAREVRAAGGRGIVAPSAALLSASAERVTLEASGLLTEDTCPSQVVVLFAPVKVIGTPLAEGRCSPDVLKDVRPL